MAAKEQSWNKPLTIIGWFILIWMANHFAIQLFKYPFVYCWLRPLATILYGPLANIINLLMLCFLFYQLIQRKILGVLLALFTVNIVFSLPMIAKELFFGGSCS